MILFVILLLLLLVFGLQARQQGNGTEPLLPTATTTAYEAPEPYPYLNGNCADCLPSQPASPDPLVRMTWAQHVNQSQLQIYRVDSPASWAIIEQGKTPVKNNNRISNFQVLKTSSIMIDWGVERAAWMELTTRDSIPKGVTLRGSLSEWNTPLPEKTATLTQYGNHTFRLETNRELYEGIRFTWLYFDIDQNIYDRRFPLVIDSVSLVAKVKPVNYTGSYQSSDLELTQAWYTGAYSVRLNMEANQLNTVLIERGDRVAIQGDGHPTIETALVAFAPFDLVANVLNQTDSGDHYVVDMSIMSYPLYWCLSVIDWFMASGNTELFETLLPDVVKIVEARVMDFLAPDLDLGWMGWDDRLGNGWCFHGTHDDCGKEAHFTFAGLVVRVSRDLGHVLRVTGHANRASYFEDVTSNLTRLMLQLPAFPDRFGVHAAANAINAFVPDEKTVDEWMESTLNDPVTVCSFSGFNQYWILQAFSNARKFELALASIKLCWSPMTRLGNGCFWELAAPDWERIMNEGDPAPGMMSFCHPWASGVTAWLTRTHVGIEPRLPGYKEVIVAPYVSERHNFVSGAVQTPFGQVHANASISSPRGQTRILSLHVQTPVNAWIGLSKSILGEADKEWKLVENKTSLFIAKEIKTSPSDEVYRRIVDFNMASSPNPKYKGVVFIKTDQPGTFRLDVPYTSDRTVADNGPVPPFPKPVFPGSVLIDPNSHGDGLEIHGKDGFVLFGCLEGNDLVSLPKYVKNITVHQHGYGAAWKEPKRTFIGSSENESSYLPTTTGRKLGMIGHDDTFGPQVNNSILVEITLDEDNVEETTAFAFSIYCVGNTSGIHQSFRAMDLLSLNPVAPISVIQDMNQTGVWWTLTYTRSVRVRVINIYGIHLSAVAVSRAVPDAVTSTERQ